MFTKKLPLFLCLLFCLLACDNSEPPTPEIREPNPTSDTVYEPIDLPIVSFSQHANPIYNPNSDSWDLYSYIIIYFPDNDICETLNGPLYYQLVAEHPSQLYFYWEWINAGGWEKEEELGRNMCINEFSDYLYSVDTSLLTPSSGRQKFRIAFYHPATNRYFITKQHEFIISEDRTCYILKL